MKKIIVAAIAVAMSVVASAASYDWKTSATGKVYGAGTGAVLSSGTAYLFDAGAVTQQTVLNTFLADGSMASGSLHNKAISAGVITGTGAEDFTAATAFDAYVAVIDGSNIYISDITPAAGADVGTSTIQFKLATSSKLALSEATTFSAGGWYAGSTPGGAPEPTSGLLLLLGMAGLALKRKVA